LINAGDRAKTKFGGFWAAMLAATPGPGGPGGPGAPSCPPAEVADPAVGLGVQAVELAVAAGLLRPVEVAGPGSSEWAIM